MFLAPKSDVRKTGHDGHDAHVAGGRGRRAKRALIVGRLLAAPLCGLLLPSCNCFRPLPEGTSVRGEERPAGKVKFLKDLTYADASGRRHTDQEIFDEWFRIIRQARRFVVIDMFLFNEIQGPTPEHTRGLAQELAGTLIAQKRRHPSMRIVVISDPVNTLYGGIPQKQFEKLEASGIELVITDLTRLPDSNPSWSGFWRLLIRPLGNSTDGWLPSPFGQKVTLRSYLSFLNFKANHRKVLVADSGADLAAAVTSANTHDASSAHSNVGLSLTGAAAFDLLQTENAVLAFLGKELVDVPEPRKAPSSEITARVLTEGKIRDDIISTLESLQRGDSLDIAMFYLSHRPVISALKDASERGARIRAILDPNRIAFGIKRKGVPNGPVARELRRAGIFIRWFDPHGEQSHSKFLLVRRADGTASMSLGSTNLTRRNLDDLNLETNVALRGPADGQVFQEALAWFELHWNNDPQRRFSAGYEKFSTSSPLKALRYRFMEATGWSTF